MMWLGLCSLYARAHRVVVAVLSCRPSQRGSCILGGSTVLRSSVLQRFCGCEAALPPRLPPTSQHHYLATHEHRTDC